MKTQNTNLLIQLNKTELTNLTQEVKETVATEVVAKKFTSADLWQIRKSTKTAAGYTRKWNLN